MSERVITHQVMSDDAAECCNDRVMAVDGSTQNVINELSGSSPSDISTSGLPVHSFVLGANPSNGFANFIYTV